MPLNIFFPLFFKDLLAEIYHPEYEIRKSLIMDVEEDNWSGLCEAEDHSRTIVHLDLDCFYAQVEELQDPSLKGKPLGVKQKQIIVTCNYAARARGVTKCMFLKDALEVCPELQLRCGEDLAVYRRCSAAVTATLAATGCPVERLGMDENWVDVSKLVIEKLSKEERLEELVTKGNVVGGSLTCSVQDCDCDKRIQVICLVDLEDGHFFGLFFRLEASLLRNLQPQFLSNISSRAVLGCPTISYYQRSFDIIRYIENCTTYSVSGDFD